MKRLETLGGVEERGSGTELAERDGARGELADAWALNHAGRREVHIVTRSYGTCLQILYMYNS